MSLTSHLPHFSITAIPKEFFCKQDKIEISIGAWETHLASDSHAAILIESMGAPPPIYRDDKRLRLRDGFDETNGWIFNRVNKESMPDRKTGIRSNSRLNLHKKVQVRTLPLEILLESGEVQTMPPPLFGGCCRWNLELVGGRLPYRLTCLLDLSINPTRHFFHQSGGRFPVATMKERYGRNGKMPHDEFSWDGADNWLPQRKLLYSRAHDWMRHVSGYLAAIEEEFEKELNRVGPGAWERPIRRYNVKKVETYIEFLAENPLALVSELQPCLSSFSPYGILNREYQNIDSAVEQNMSILRTQTAPGEHLKIYSKTNRRIRLEVVHNFRKDDRFQFPRKRNVKESSAHEFQSIDDTVDFLRRLGRKSEEVFGAFLSHAKRQKKRQGFETPPYQTLLHVLYSLPRDYDTALTLSSMLVHNKRIVIPSGASESFRDGVRSLLKGGIIEKGRGRSIYIARRPYKDAFAIMAEDPRWMDSR